MPDIPKPMPIEVTESPITPREAYSGEYWRRRARMTREKISERASDATRTSLERVAREYEKLADRADGVQQAIAKLDSCELSPD